MSWWDDWPADFDGTGLFQSLEREDPPIFRFDVRNILEEVEEHLGSKVVDIPKVGKGSNYFVSFSNLRRRPSHLSCTGVASSPHERLGCASASSAV